MTDPEREELRRAADRWSRHANGESGLYPPEAYPRPQTDRDLLAESVPALLSRLDALEAERQGWSSNVAAMLRREADRYQILDGEPGPLGFNCWGWRDIARVLRSVADKVSPLPQPPEG